MYLPTPAATASTSFRKGTHQSPRAPTRPSSEAAASTSPTPSFKVWIEGHMRCLTAYIVVHTHRGGYRRLGCCAQWSISTVWCTCVLVKIHHHYLVYRVLSTDNTSRAQHASMPHVASTGRLSERRSSIDEQDVFGALGGLEIGGCSATGQHHAAPSAPPAMTSTVQPPPARLGDIPLGQLSRTLYVRGVDPSVKDEDLYTVFEVRIAACDRN